MGKAVKLVDFFFFTSKIIFLYMIVLYWIVLPKEKLYKSNGNEMSVSVDLMFVLLDIWQILGQNPPAVSF